MREVSVGELNRSVYRFITKNVDLSQVKIKGELSNVKLYASGHLYFSLKDAEAQVACVMWKNKVQQLPFKVKDGVSVLVQAEATFFEKSGQFQLQVVSMEACGEHGDVYRQFLEAKAKYEKLGYFDARYKKTLPFLPQKVGVVTSAHGAVIQDIIHVASKRYPKRNLLLYPSAVQGEQAVPELIAGLRYLDARKDVDVIIIGRGGGSQEDLWCFNHPDLVEAIFQCNTPVVSAVGHETDFTLCDFVADHRAPTPSAAAEMIFPVAESLHYLLQTHTQKLKQVYLQKQEKLAFTLLHLEDQKEKKIKELFSKKLFSLKEAEKKLALFEPKKNLLRYQEKVLHLRQKLLLKVEQQYEQKQANFVKNLEKLDALSPLKVLQRGYSRTLYQGKTLESVKNVPQGAEVQIELKDGQLLCEVKETKENARKA